MELSCLTSFMKNSLSILKRTPQPSADFPSLALVPLCDNLAKPVSDLAKISCEKIPSKLAIRPKPQLSK